MSLTRGGPSALGTKNWRAFCRRVVLAGMACVAIPAAAQMTIPTKFAVSPSGAATYSIPLRVPAGITAVQPQLSLDYNSQSNGGLLGKGWDLSGFSVITRCPKTMLQDGVRAGVNFDLNDRYCLDGQRLVSYAGTYGTSGSEYRTESETFSKVLAYGDSSIAPALIASPAYFIVKTKDGLTMEYGRSSDSRIFGRLVSGASNAVVATWALSKVSDVKGNYISFN